MDNKTKTKFGTFAFFDLETTGLPDFNFGKANIIEFCVSAISTNDLINTKKNEVPRIKHNLSLLFNPMMMIHPEASEIHGLDNYMLENHNTFDENAAATIIGFFKHLNGPICLVAHNGVKYDFPILKKAFKKLNLSLPDNIYCVDSYEAIPHIDNMKKHFKEKDIVSEIETTKEEIDGITETEIKKEENCVISENGVKIEKQNGVIAENEIKKENCVISQNGSKKEEKQEISESEIKKEENELLNLEDEFEKIIPLSELEKCYNIQGELKTNNKFKMNMQQINETTPKRPKTGLNDKSEQKFPRTIFIKRDDILSNHDDSLSSTTTQKKVKRELFNKKSPKRSAIKLPKSPLGYYKLGGIFKRIFYEPKISHHADADVEMLQKIIIYYGKDFVDYSEVNAIKFSEV